MNKKKWKIVKIITLSILILFIIYILFIGLKCRFAKVKYPYPALGIEVFNWKDAFLLELNLRLYILGIPMLIDIILLMISIFKQKK